MSTRQRAYKTELNPTADQVQAFVLQSDVTRFVWNWALGRKQEHYKATKQSLKSGELIKEFRAIRKERWPWTIGASSRAEETALRNLDAAFKNFFEKRGKYPRFKSRKRGTVAFSYWSIKPEHVTADAIRLQGMGWIRLKERGYLPTAERGVKINRATVSERGGRWFVSLQVEETYAKPIEFGAALGVDPGIKTLVTVSDGRQFANPKSQEKAARKVRKLNKKLARQQKGSARRERTKIDLQRAYMRAANVRTHATHNATSAVIAGAPIAIGIETLNVAGMVRNHSLARAVSDANMSEVLRQIRYKSDWAGIHVTEADRWFPSSKMCSQCGVIHASLQLSDRMYRCAECGFECDRDLNAALNLAALAAKSVESLNARGEARPEQSCGDLEPSEKREPCAGGGVLTQ